MRLITIILIVSLIFLFGLPSLSKGELVVTEFKIESEIILPGDICKGYLEVQNKGESSEKLNDIMLFYDESIIDLKPDYLGNIGVLPPSATYKFYFTVTAKNPGVTKVEVLIRGEAKWLKYTFNIIVREIYPKIVINKTLILNEVNLVSFYVICPVEIENIVVKPLFDAEPQEIYLKDKVGYFKFTPKSKQTLKFKISFYLNKNYHEVIQEVTPVYKKSLGIGVNVSSNYVNVVIGDVVEICLTVTNLREDNIYFLKILPVSKKGIFHSESKEIFTLDPGESKIFRFLYSPTESGKNLLFFDICYKDSLDNIHYATEILYLYVNDEKQLMLTNLNVETTGVIRIKGDISNQGRSKAYNVFAKLNAGNEEKSYFIGSIESSDFESFEFEIKSNVTKAELCITWNNEIGEKFELKKEIKITQLPAKPKSPVFITAALVFSLGILILLSAIWIKRLWKKRS